MSVEPLGRGTHVGLLTMDDGSIFEGPWTVAMDAVGQVASFGRLDDDGQPIYVLPGCVRFVHVADPATPGGS